MTPIRVDVSTMICLWASVIVQIGTYNPFSVKELIDSNVVRQGKLGVPLTPPANDGAPAIGIVTTVPIAAIMIHCVRWLVRSIRL